MRVPSLYLLETMHPDICRNDGKANPGLAGKSGILRNQGASKLNRAIALKPKKVGAA